MADARYWLGMSLVNAGTPEAMNEAKPHFEAYLKLAPTGASTSRRRRPSSRRSSSPSVNDIAGNLAAIRARIAAAAAAAGRDPEDVRLLAVSKTFGADHVRAAYAAGQRDFGENKVQEALQKIAETAELEIRWHLIGHLQSNKVKKAAPAFAAIHAIDSVDLVRRVDAAAVERGAAPDLYIQVDLAGESTKFGAPEADVPGDRAGGARVPGRAAERTDAAAAVVRRPGTGPAVFPAPARAAGAAGGGRHRSLAPPRAVDGHEPRLRSGDPGRGHARARRHRDFRQTDCEDLMFERTSPPRPADDPVAPQPPERVMRISPMDMRQQRFKTAMRGYDRTDVVAFLTEAADDYEHAMREIDRLRGDLMRMEALLAEHRERENNLRDTLLTAQRLSDGAEGGGADRGQADRPRGAGARRRAASRRPRSGSTSSTTTATS